MYQLPRISLISLILLTNCQSRQTNQSNFTAPPDSVASAPQGPTASCYAFASDKDTVGLMLTQTNTRVRGDLLYKLAGKDKNAGTVEGEMHGDTLLATYTFQSEGAQSVREVVFLKQPNGFVEGYGPVRQQRTQQTFADHTKLTFDANRPLQPIPCP